jgi:hypothetical protein
MPYGIEFELFRRAHQTIRSVAYDGMHPAELLDGGAEDLRNIG